MSIKLFVTDLDGTLLPSGKDVPCENIEAVQQAVFDKFLQLVNEGSGDDE